VAAITLYYSPGACSLAPHIVLREVGADFALSRVPLAERANYAPEYLHINPKARVPALAIDGFILTETAAILAVLGRRFPAAGLYPESSKDGGGEAEARCLEWLAWQTNTVHIAFAQVWRAERFVEREADFPPVQASGRANIARYCATIEERLAASPFAVGDRISIADPMLLVFYRWGVRLGMAMDAYPAWTRFTAAMMARPAVKAAFAAEEIVLG
jgi:glutathione S-transferase